MLTYMLRKSSHWTIYLNSVAFKSLFGSNFQQKNSVHGCYISHVRLTNLYLQVFWNQILSYPEVEQLVTSWSFLFVSIQLTVLTSRYNATCINGRRVSKHGMTPNKDRKSTHYCLLACVILQRVTFQRILLSQSLNQKHQMHCLPNSRESQHQRLQLYSEPHIISNQYQLLHPILTCLVNSQDTNTHLLLFPHYHEKMSQFPLILI